MDTLNATGNLIKMPCFERLLAIGDRQDVESFVRFMRNRAKGELAETTQRNYLRGLYRFVRYLGLSGSTPLRATVRKGTINEVLESIPSEKTSTRRNYFYAMQAFADFLSSREYIADDVYRGIKDMEFCGQTGRRREYLTDGELSDILTCIIERRTLDAYSRILNVAMISTLALVGFRNSELCDLTLADVRIGDGEAFVRKGKGNKARWVGIPERLRPLLQTYLKYRPQTKCDRFFVNAQGKPFNRDSIVQRFQRISEIVGKRAYAHLMRHTFATRAVERGVPMNQLQSALGHSRLSTTLLYVDDPKSGVIKDMANW